MEARRSMDPRRSRSRLKRHAGSSACSPSLTRGRRSLPPKRRSASDGRSHLILTFGLSRSRRVWTEHGSIWRLSPTSACRLHGVERLGREWLKLDVHQASLNLIHRLTNSLNFDCPLARRGPKLTRSKSGGPTFRLACRMKNPIPRGAVFGVEANNVSVDEDLRHRRVGRHGDRICAHRLADRRLHHYRGPNGWRKSHHGV